MENGPTNSSMAADSFSLKMAPTTKEHFAMASQKEKDATYLTTVASMKEKFITTKRVGKELILTLFKTTNTTASGFKMFHTETVKKNFQTGLIIKVSL